MLVWTFAVINESTAVTDAQVEDWLPALQTQVSQHFAPIYGVDAHLRFVERSATPPRDAWQLIVLDDSAQAQTLGYHDVTSTGQPLGKVFAKNDLAVGASASATCSHELLEMLGDPSINNTVMMQNDAGHIAAFPFEVCDMCEADCYGYQINGVTVSDFAYPSWFDGRPNPDGVAPDALDHVGVLHTPLSMSDPASAILPGGYLGMWTPTAGWTQLVGSDRVTDPAAVPPVGSRRERRTRPTSWTASVPPSDMLSRRAS